MTKNTIIDLSQTNKITHVKNISLTGNKQNKLPIIQWNIGKRIIANSHLIGMNTIYLLQEPLLQKRKPQVLEKKEFFYFDNQSRAAIYAPGLQNSQISKLEDFCTKDQIACVLENPGNKPIILASIYLDILNDKIPNEWKNLIKMSKQRIYH